MEWKELSKLEKNRLIKKTYGSISENEESVNFYVRFKTSNPDIEIKKKELFEWLSSQE